MSKIISPKKAIASVAMVLSLGTAAHAWEPIRPAAPYQDYEISKSYPTNDKGEVRVTCQSGKLLSASILSKATPDIVHAFYTDGKGGSYYQKEDDFGGPAGPRVYSATPLDDSCCEKGIDGDTARNRLMKGMSTFPEPKQ